MQALIHIPRSEVPEYLHDSELYFSFDEDNDDEIRVPSHCLKMDKSVRSIAELDNFLSTTSFWIAYPFRIELISYVVDHRFTGVKDVVAKYRVNYPTLYLIVAELHRTGPELIWNIAAKYGCIEFLKFYTERKKPVDVYTENRS